MMDKIPIRDITTTSKDSKLTEGFSIRDVSTMLGGKNMIQPLHRHNFFFVLALKKGKGEHSIDFVSYPVSDHTLFFLRPGQIHQLSLFKGSVGYLMSFNQNFYSPAEKNIKEVFRKVSAKSHCVLAKLQSQKIFNVLESMHEEFNNKDDRYQEIIKASLNIFLIHLSRQHKNLKKPPTQANSYAQDRYEELCELFEKNIASLKQVTDYANLLNITPYQLNAITKNTVGKTCSQLIDEYVILEAKRYLLATTNLVNQIADQLGYDDVSYFIRFFKKHVGCSPEVFRKNFK